MANTSHQKPYDVLSGTNSIYEEKGIRLFDSHSGAEIANLIDHDTTINSVHLSELNYRMLAVGKFRASIWNIATKKLIRSFESQSLVEDNKGEFLSGALSSDGQRMAIEESIFEAPDCVRYITVYETDSGRVLCRFKIKAECGGESLYPQLSKDGSYLLVRKMDLLYGITHVALKAVDSVITIIDTNTGHTIFSETSPQTNHVASAILKEDDTVSLADWNEHDRQVHIRIFNCRNASMRELNWHIDNTTRGICFLSGGKLLACRKQKSLDIHDAETGRLLYSRSELMKFSDMFWHVSRDGTYFINFSDAGLALWDLQHNSFIGRYKDEEDTIGYRSDWGLDPFGDGPQEDAWTVSSVSTLATHMHDADSNQFIEPVPSGVRIWRQQYPATWYGVLFLPEVFLSLMLAFTLVWRIIAIFHSVAKQLEHPWWYRLSVSLGRTLVCVSWSAWACAALALLSGYLLWQHWEPYQLVHEWPGNVQVDYTDESPRIASVDQSGIIEVWNQETAQRTQQFIVPLDSDSIFLDLNPLHSITRHGNPVEPTFDFRDTLVFVNKISLWDLRTGKCIAQFAKPGILNSGSSPVKGLFWVDEGEKGLGLFDFERSKFAAQFPDRKLSYQIEPWHLAVLDGKNNCCLFDLDQLKILAYLKRDPDSSIPHNIEVNSKPILETNGSLRFDSRTPKFEIRQFVPASKLPDLKSREEKVIPEEINKVRFEDINEGRVIINEKLHIKRLIDGTALVISSDEQSYFVKSSENELLQFSVADGKLIRSFGTYDDDSVLYITFANKNRWLVVNNDAKKPSDPNVSVIFNLENGERIFSLAQRLPSGFSFNHGVGNFVATASTLDPEVGRRVYSTQLWRLARAPSIQGILSLPWLWMTTIFSILFLWRAFISIQRRAQTADI